MPTGKKTHLNLTVDPELKAMLERYAALEDRSLGNLGELLIKWAYKQLEIAGNSIELMNWEAQPQAKKRQKRGAA